MKKLRYIQTLLALALIVIVVAGCGSGAKVVTTVPSKDQQPRQIVNRYAYAYYVSGLLAEKEQQFPTAIRSYEEALKHSPGNSEILYTLAELHYNLRQFQVALETANKIVYKDKKAYMLIGNCHRVFSNDAEAEHAYRKVVKMDPDDMHAHWYIAGYAGRRNEYETAIHHMREVARINPTSGIYTEMAKVHMSQRKLDDAIEAYEKSLEIDSSGANVESYVNLATLLLQSDESAEAEELLLTGIRRNPEEASIRVYLAEMYSDMNDTVKALDQVRLVRHMALDDLPMMDRAGQIAYELDYLDLADSIFRYELSLFPESVLGNYFRGRIAIFQDRPEDAKQFFWKLIEVADSLPDGYINLGMIYLDEDSLDVAIDVLKEGVARSTTGREEAQFYLATALGRAERYGEVTAIAETLAGAHPGEIRFLFMLGSALERQGEADSAAVLFEKILKVDPNHAQTLNYLGYMWADLDTNLQRSFELIRKAIELDGDNPAYLDSYGWVLYRLGRYEEAETHLKRAIELMDDHDYVLYDHIAEVYIGLGQIEDAKANWRKALEIDPDNAEIKEKLAR